HRHSMRDLCKLFEGLAADAPRWGVIMGKLREFFLELDQFPIKLVVFSVTDGGRGFFVVTAIVFFDAMLQRFDARPRFRFGHVLIIRKRVRETIGSGGL